MTQYWSMDSQITHWSVHKLNCKNSLRNSSWNPAWEVEQRKLTFMVGSTPGLIIANGTNLHALREVGLKQIWENAPAIDLLQLADNEDRNTSQDIHLLLAVTYLLLIQGP